MVVESATPTIELAVGFGRKIGTNADLTTSICSSSESSDSFISMEMFILIRSLCADDGGLDDDGRDDVGDSRDVLRCSGVRFEMIVDSDDRLVLC